MKQRALFVLIAILAFPLFAADMYMKIPNIDGQSTAAGHEKWIELESVQWGATGFRGGVSVATGDVNAAPECAQAKTAEVVTNVKKMYDGARSGESRPLQIKSAFEQAATSGPVRVKLTARAKGYPVTHELENVRFRSFRSTPTGPDFATETITLEFDRCLTHDAPAAIAAGPNGVTRSAAGTSSNTYTGLTVVAAGTGGRATLTLTKVGAGTLQLAGTAVTPGKMLDEMSLEMNDGRKWTFGKIKFNEFVVKKVTDTSVEVSFDFASSNAVPSTYDLAILKRK